MRSYNTLSSQRYVGEQYWLPPPPRPGWFGAVRVAEIRRGLGSVSVTTVSG